MSISSPLTRRPGRAMVAVRRGRVLLLLGERLMPGMQRRLDVRARRTRCSCCSRKSAPMLMLVAAGGSGLSAGAASSRRRVRAESFAASVCVCCFPHSHRIDGLRLLVSNYHRHASHVQAVRSLDRQLIPLTHLMCHHCTRPVSRPDPHLIPG